MYCEVVSSIPVYSRVVSGITVCVVTSTGTCDVFTSTGEHVCVVVMDNAIIVVRYDKVQ